MAYCLKTPRHYLNQWWLLINEVLWYSHESNFTVSLQVPQLLSRIMSLKTIHYDDVIMTTIASQITSLTVVYSIVYSDADERKHQSSASLAFMWGIHRDRWIPRTKGQLRGKCFHLMTSSWLLKLPSYIPGANKLWGKPTLNHYKATVPRGLSGVRWPGHILWWQENSNHL